MNWNNFAILDNIDQRCETNLNQPLGDCEGRAFHFMGDHGWNARDGQFEETVPEVAKATVEAKGISLFPLAFDNHDRSSGIRHHFYQRGHMRNRRQNDPERRMFGFDQIDRFQKDRQMSLDLAMAATGQNRDNGRIFRNPMGFSKSEGVASAAAMKHRMTDKSRV